VRAQSREVGWIRVDQQERVSIRVDNTTGLEDRVTMGQAELTGNSGASVS
jgi:hypothetical protein